MKLSLRTRRPTNQLIAAPASGAKMIRLRRLFSIETVFGFWTLVFGSSIQRPKIKGPIPNPPKSQLQDAGIIHIQCFAIAEDGDDDSQTDGGLSCSDGHHDKNKKLTDDV